MLQGPFLCYLLAIFRLKKKVAWKCLGLHVANLIILFLKWWKEPLKITIFFFIFWKKIHHNKKKTLFVTSKCPDIHMLQILHFQIPSLHNLGNLNPPVEVCIALNIMKQITMQHNPPQILTRIITIRLALQICSPYNKYWGRKQPKWINPNLYATFFKTWKCNIHCLLIQ